MKLEITDVSEFGFICNETGLLEYTLDEIIGYNWINKINIFQR